MSLDTARAATSSPAKHTGAVVKGEPFTIRDGFKAQHFNEEMFDGAMDPLVMVDHFVMTGPTFEPHLHAGISAVTFIFEDATGAFLNRDTLGNNVALQPGDLYWLNSGSGAVHDERPEPGARIHALQIFVKLPKYQETAQASALHVKAGDMPLRTGPGYRVRVAVGASGEVQGAAGTPQDMTVLDGALEADGHFVHPLAVGHSAWIYAASGDLTLELEGQVRTLKSGSAIAIDYLEREVDLTLNAKDGSHFVLMSSPPLQEPFVKHGPLVMSSMADVRRTLQDYQAGRFGKIAA